MSKFTAVVKNFVREEEGAALVEYGLLVGLIAVVCIAAIGILGTSISTMFANVNSAITAAS